MFLFNSFMSSRPRSGLASAYITGLLLKKNLNASRPSEHCYTQKAHQLYHCYCCATEVHTTKYRNRRHALTTLLDYSTSASLLQVVCTVYLLIDLIVCRSFDCCVLGFRFIRSKKAHIFFKWLYYESTAISTYRDKCDSESKQFII